MDGGWVDEWWLRTDKLCAVFFSDSHYFCICSRHIRVLDPRVQSIIPWTRRKTTFFLMRRKWKKVLFFLRTPFKWNLPKKNKNGMQLTKEIYSSAENAHAKYSNLIRLPPAISLICMKSSFEVLLLLFGVCHVPSCEKCRRNVNLIYRFSKTNREERTARIVRRFNFVFSFSFARSFHSQVTINGAGSVVPNRNSLRMTQTQNL